MKKNLIVPRPDRIRKIQGSFSWIDHQIITQSWLMYLTKEEILLYLFWVLVGDRQGLSYYSHEKTASLLKTSVAEIVLAMDSLIEKGLIAYHRGIIQVLAVPKAETL